jgi:hypothetical protein
MPNFDRFKKGLKDNYDMDYETIKIDWKYCGGDTGRHLNYYRLCYKKAKLPEHHNYCVCGHFITENCFITDNKQLLVLGNCCIKAFLVKNGRTCEDCGNSHKNRIINKCNDCKNKEKYKYCSVCKCEKHPNYIKYSRCYNCYINDRGY